MVSLQDHVSASSLDSEHSSQSLKREILQQIDAGFSTQAEMQAQAHPLLLAGISQLLDAALKKDRETYSGKNPPPGIDKPFDKYILYLSLSLCIPPVFWPFCRFAISHPQLKSTKNI